jgi:cyclopropane fatty-acyl-phospholipid synthase-like methyltransferase
MIAECRRRLDAAGLDAELRCADMTELDDREAYDAVLAMDSVITYLLEAEQVADALRRFHAALRPGGLLVLDNHNLLHMWDTSDEPYRGETGDENVRISYVDRRWYDDFPSIFHVEIVAQVEENGESYEVLNEEVLKAMTADEVRQYLAAAGFADVRVLPEYDLDAPPALTSERMIFLAAKE